MAKRKNEIVVEHVVGDLYDAWMDEEVADRALKIPGVHEVYGRSCGAPWGIKIDPRYDADEVMAEIKALTEEKEPMLWDGKLYDHCRRRSYCWPRSRIPSLVKDEAEALAELAFNKETLERGVIYYLKYADKRLGYQFNGFLWHLLGKLLERLQKGSW